MKSEVVVVVFLSSFFATFFLLSFCLFVDNWVLLVFVIYYNVSLIFETNKIFLTGNDTFFPLKILEWLNFIDRVKKNPYPVICYYQAGDLKNQSQCHGGHLDTGFICLRSLTSFYCYAAFSNWLWQVNKRSGSYTAPGLDKANKISSSLRLTTTMALVPGMPSSFLRW